MIKNHITKLILVFVLAWSCNKKRAIFFQNNDGKLATQQETDSVIQLRNKKMKDKNIDMVFRKEITDTIYDNNKIIYRYTLKGESKAITKNTNQYEKMIGKKLPRFSLKSIDGNLVTSDELLGKPLVINMWFTTCAPCIAEMPELNKIKADASNKEVQFLAVTYENNEKVTQFLEKKTFDFTHLVDAKDYCETFTNQFPINIFVNRNGIITDIKGGMPLIYDSKLKKITDKVNPKNFIKALEEIK